MRALTGTSGVSPPYSSITHAVLGQLGLDAVRVGVGLVDLVDRDDDRHLGGAGVVDRLERLGHDAVIGGDDEHGDVGHLARHARAWR